MEHLLQRNVPLHQYTTLHVGGVADYYARVTNLAELKEAIHFAKQAEVPIFILGGGSNVLISDNGFSGLVIKMEIAGISFNSQDNEVLATAGAGESWDALVAVTVMQGLSGLENLSGIPGTVGAAPVQNINAYGVSVADTIRFVEVYDTTTDTIKTLTNAECQFGYRDSILKRVTGKHLVVTAVTFALVKESEINVSYASASQSIKKYLQEKNCTTPTVIDVREAILHVRHNIGMLLGQYRSAGSFFKNTIVTAEEFLTIEEIVQRDFKEVSDKLAPWHWLMPDGRVKIATAFLFECSPYNKNTYGNKRFNDVVGLSPKHSLSIVTEEGARAKDVEEFAEKIIASVKNIFGVTIETEVDYI